jgi:hypothetical protein
LEDPLFTKIREPSFENVSPKEINITIDCLPLNEKTGVMEDYSVRKMKQYLIKIKKKINQTHY